MKKFLLLTIIIGAFCDAFWDNNKDFNDQPKKYKYNYADERIDGEEANWDDRVAQKAQEHANGRNFDHDKYEYRYFMDGSTQAFMGQNLGLAEVEKNPNFVKTIDEMFNDEIDMLRKANVIDPFVFQTAYGHASQIIWGTTAHLGCGSSFIRQCESCLFNSNDIRDICLLTCNYDPPGNYDKDNTPMYVETNGRAGDRCPRRATGRYDALCNTPTYLIDPSPNGRCTP